jgi:hypothetical protein
VSIHVRSIVVAGICSTLLAASWSYAQEITPTAVARKFTIDAMGGCLKRFDANGNKPRESLNTQPSLPEEEATFEAMGIKCGRAIILPSQNTVIAQGSKQKPPPEPGCRFLFERMFISVSGISTQDLRAVVLYPEHNFTLDIDRDSVQARTMENVPLVPDFDQLVRTVQTAIEVCQGGATSIAPTTAAVPSVRAKDDDLAQPTDLAGQLEAAINDFQQRCSRSIMDDRTPSELDCGNGAQSKGEQWSTSMTRVGIPAGMDQREELARKAGLNPSLSLVLVAPLARPEAIQALREALKKR